MPVAAHVRERVGALHPDSVLRLVEELEAETARVAELQAAVDQF